jgi:hypothetical protein
MQGKHVWSAMHVINTAMEMTMVIVLMVMMIIAVVTTQSMG